MLTVDEIIQCTGAICLQRSKKMKISSVSHDTRTIKRRSLFIAIKGERFDGHQFVQAAVEKGCSAVLVSTRIDKISSDITILLVKDTLIGLGKIAAFYRKKLELPIIAVTGSAGKTTTKNMISSVLSAKYRVLKSARSENNQIGVPFTLLKIKQSHQIAVLELGTNHPGEIKYLAEMVNPDIAVLTNIGESHLEGLGSTSGVYREKMSLLKYVKKQGAVIYNSDDAFLKKIGGSKLFSLKKYPYSVKAAGKYRADFIKVINNNVEFKVQQKNYQLKTPFKHNVYNAMVAICCGEIFKLKYNDIYKSLKSFRFTNGRQEIKKMRNFWVINDTYNANSLSMRSAIQTLSDIDYGDRKIIICADMMELGSSAVKLHEQMGVLIAQSKINVLFTVGKLSEHMLNAAKKSNRDLLVRHFSKVEEVKSMIRKFIHRNDVLLIKGSRKMRMDQLINVVNTL